MAPTAEGALSGQAAAAMRRKFRTAMIAEARDRPAQKNFHALRGGAGERDADEGGDNCSGGTGHNAGLARTVQDLTAALRVGTDGGHRKTLLSDPFV